MGAYKRIGSAPTACRPSKCNTAKEVHNMRIAVNAGHTKAAPGAVGYLNEVEANRPLAAALIAELRARGHEVVDVTSPDNLDQNNDLYMQCAAANQSGAELAVTVHFNAGGGNGPEVWYWQGNKSGAVYASKVSEAIAEAIGRPNRGAKTGTPYYFLKHTHATGLIIETCFVDTLEDAQAYNAAGPAKVAAAIADAISGTKYGVMAGLKPQKPARVPLEVDGIKGAKTVSRLQEVLGVTVDGIEGPETIKALQEALNGLEV